MDTLHIPPSEFAAILPSPSCQMQSTVATYFFKLALYLALMNTGSQFFKKDTMRIQTIASQSATLFQQNLLGLGLGFAVSMIEIKDLQSAYAGIVSSLSRLVVDVLAMNTVHKITKSVLPEQKVLHFLTRPVVGVPLKALSGVVTMIASKNGYLKAAVAGNLVGTAASAAAMVGVGSAYVRVSRSYNANKWIPLSNLGFQVVDFVATNNLIDTLKEIKFTPLLEKKDLDRIQTTRLVSAYQQAEQCPSKKGCPNALELEISSPSKLWDAYRCTKKE